VTPLPEPFAVRPMIHADLAAVLALTRLVPEAPWWSDAHVAGIVQPAQEGDRQFRRGWVCVVHEKPVGFIVLQALCLPVADDPAIECEVESIVVAPECRGRGFGRALLMEALDWGRHRGALLVHLEVRSRNDRAIGLYRHAGFRPTGVRPDYYHSPADDAILMTLQLRQA
jgi:ribosomal-protein-alanine N-acetyltransferase